MANQRCPRRLSRPSCFRHLPVAGEKSLSASATLRCPFRFSDIPPAGTRARKGEGTSHTRLACDWLSANPETGLHQCTAASLKKKLFPCISWLWLVPCRQASRSLPNRLAANRQRCLLHSHNPLSIRSDLYSSLAYPAEHGSAGWNRVKPRFLYSVGTNFSVQTTPYCWKLGCGSSVSLGQLILYTRAFQGQSSRGRGQSEPDYSSMTTCMQLLYGLIWRRLVS